MPRGSRRATCSGQQLNSTASLLGCRTHLLRPRHSHQPAEIRTHPRAHARLQELEFSCSSQRAKVSPDGGFLAVTGIHPPQVWPPGHPGRPRLSASFMLPAVPDRAARVASALQVRVYELSQLALKFERHLLSEVIDFQVGRLAGGRACQGHTACRPAHRLKL